MHTRKSLRLNARTQHAHTLHARKNGVQPAAAAIAAAASAAAISIKQRRALVVAVAAVRR